MDLDGFGKTGAHFETLSKTKLTTAKDAVQYVDDVWYSEANRQARWMDLLGDYAGSELFVIDGAFVVMLTSDLRLSHRQATPSFKMSSMIRC